MATAYMDNAGEQSFPAQGNESAIFTGRMHDRPDKPGLLEPQDARLAGLVKLTIPEPSLRTQNLPSAYAHSACEMDRSPFSTAMQDQSCGSLRTRNVIVFGESGVGKSSVINMIAGEDVTRTSNNAVGCTFRYRCHNVVLDGLSVNLWDTIGLDEGTEGTIPAQQAESSLGAFLRQMTQRNSIDLLLYCVRGTRVRQALLRNYNIFYAAVCRKKVPVALIVTGLENYEGDMEEWWTQHEKDLIKHGMRFDAHACVTTICSNHPAIQGRVKSSRDALRSLVRAKVDMGSWKADEETLNSVSLSEDHVPCAAEKWVSPLIMICDTIGPVNHPLSPGSIVRREPCISDQRYQCIHVDARWLLSGQPTLAAQTTQRPNLLIFRADANSEPDQIWIMLEQFFALFGGETCPIIIVFGGLDNQEAATKRWGKLSSSRGGKIMANPTYFPGPDSAAEAMERADDALAALIEKCLVKFEEKMTKFQKLYSRGKRILSRRT